MSLPEIIEIGGSKAALYRSSPSLRDLKTAAIGSLSISDVVSGATLFDTIIQTARDEGFEALLGPLDGDTWHAYRVVTESDGSPPFLLEPRSGLHDLAALQAAEFEPVSQYMSARAPISATLADDPVSVDGIQVEAWDGTEGERLIRHLFDMSTASFDANRYFTPITFENFLAIYQPLLPMIDPRQVLFAHDGNGDLQGFLFGMPNVQNQDGTPEVILKTYASRMRGVGHLLADTFHRRALEMGFEAVIHALIHEDNTSRDRSEKHGAQVFRRYALMGKIL